MKRKLFALLTAAAMLMTSFAIALPAAADAAEGKVGNGPAVYIDSNSVSSTEDGTQENPYKTLSPIHDKSGIQPGTTFYIKYGSVFNSGIKIKSSGEEGNPITLTTYGDPADGKPVINGGKNSVEAQQAILIFSEGHITIDGLKLTCYNPENYNDFQEGKIVRRSGIWVAASPWEGSQTVVKGLTFTNLEITDVTGVTINENFGINGDGINSTSGWMSQSANAAIQLNQWQNDGASINHFEDVLIENCYIHDVNTVGINVDGYFPNDKMAAQAKNVVIRNNVIYRTGCDGMVIGHCDSPVIENNVVYHASDIPEVTDFYWTAALWVWGCNGNTIVQQNEVAHTKAMPQPGDSDAAAFDTDIASYGDYYFQYNYTHDNEGGFYFNMGDMEKYDPNGVNYVRYNISENDMRYNNFSAQMKLADPTVFTNNVFYNDVGGTGDLRISVGDRVEYINNVFYQENASGPLVSTSRSDFVFANNALYGTELPQTQAKNEVFESGGDMGFVNIGSAGDTWTVGSEWSPEIMKAGTAGYKLKADSPLIGAGKYVALNADTANYGGRDYFGNPIYTGSPDIGVYEYESDGSSDTTKPEAPTNLSAPVVTDSTVSLVWTSLKDGVPTDAKIYRDGVEVAYVVAGNSYQDTGLESTTEYTYTVRAVSDSGVESDASAELNVTTADAPIILNAGDATVDAGDWEAASGSGSYDNTYMVSEDAAASLTWVPEIRKAGYYNLYYWMPNGNMLKTRNAQLDIVYDGGVAHASIDQRAAGGEWVLVSTYRFDTQGGSVTLHNGSSGELNAGAIRLIYAGDTLDTSAIDRVSLNVGTGLLAVGETTSAMVTGSDPYGRTFDLSAVADAAVAFVVDNTDVVDIADGVITAKAEGVARVSATVTVNGAEYTTDPVLVQVGSGFAIAAPETSLEDGTMDILVPIGNFTGKDKRVTVIAAVYDGKQMLSHAASDMVTLKSMNAINVTLQVNAADGNTVQLFLWDSLTELHPIADPISL